MDTLRIYSASNSYLNYNLQPDWKTTQKLTTDLAEYEFTIYTTSVIDFHLESQSGLVRFDIVRDTTTLYFGYIINYDYEIVEYGSTKHYCYVIQGVSAEYRLQRISLPNKTITEVVKDTPRSVYEELVRIMTFYASNTTLDPNLAGILNMPCPEMQFTKSTLYEVLVKLFAIGNIIPKIKNNPYYLSYIALSKNVALANGYFDKVEHRRNFEDYADGIDVDLENAIGKDMWITTEWIKPTTDEALLTTDNFFWELPYNIYAIKKVELYVTVSVYGGAGEPSYDYTETYTITPYIVEEKIYNSLLLSNQNTVTSTQYKRGNMYFKQGANFIKGATFNEKTWIAGLSSKTALECICCEAANYSGLAIKDENLRSALLQVTYQPDSDNTRVMVGRNNIFKSENRLISNQDDAYIDAVSFGKKQQEDLMRLGNEKVTGTKKHHELSTIASLGDYDEDYIITTQTLIYKDGIVNEQSELSKYYPYITGYAALKQIKRFTSIDTDNTTIRNDVVLKNIQITKTAYAGNTLTNYLGNNFGKTTKCNLHIIQTKFADNTYSDYLLMPSQNNIIGNAITVQVKFPDNITAGKQVYNTSLSAYYQKYVKYTDENGEFENLYFNFGSGEYYRNVNTYDIVRDFPVIPSNATEPFTTTWRLLQENLPLKKDHREIISITIQFAIHHDEGIVLYDEFYRCISLINGTTRDFAIYKDNEEIRDGIVVFTDNVISLTNISNTTGDYIIFDNEENKEVLMIKNATPVYNSNQGYYEIKIYIKEQQS